MTANRVSQSAGLFYLDPRLAWGASPMPADAYGGYYRIDYQRSAGRLFGSIDVSRSVSGKASTPSYADAGIRQRLSAINNIAVGVGAALRIAEAGRRVLTSSALSGSTTKQVTIYGEATTGLGGSRAEGSYAFDASDDILQLSFTQTWHLPSGRLSGLRLSTQVFYDRQHDRQLDGTASSSDGFGGAVSAAVICSPASTLIRRSPTVGHPTGLLVPHRQSAGRDPDEPAGQRCRHIRRSRRSEARLSRLPPASMPNSRRSGR